MSDTSELDNIINQLNPYSGPGTLDSESIVIDDNDVIKDDEIDDGDLATSHEVSVDVLESNLLLDDDTEAKLVDLISILDFYLKCVADNECDRIHFDTLRELVKRTSDYSNPTVEFLIEAESSESNKGYFKEYLEGYLVLLQAPIMNATSKIREAFHELIRVIALVDNKEVRSQHVNMKTLLSTVNQCYMTRKGKIFNAYKLEFKKLKAQVYEDEYDTPYFGELDKLIDVMDYNDKTLDEISGLIDVTLETLYSVNLEEVKGVIKLSDSMLESEVGFNIIDGFSVEDVKTVLDVRERFVPIIHEAAKACKLFGDENIYRLIEEGCVKIL